MAQILSTHSYRIHMYTDRHTHTQGDPWDQPLGVYEGGTY